MSNANRLVVFPAGKLAEAQNYLDTCNADFSANWLPGGMIYAEVKFDYLGQPVVGYYGPPWRPDPDKPFDEPAACLAARADGVIVDSVRWPHDVEE